MEVIAYRKYATDVSGLSKTTYSAIFSKTSPLNNKTHCLPSLPRMEDIVAIQNTTLKALDVKQNVLPNRLRTY